MKAAGSTSAPLPAGTSPSGGGERRSINPELWYACAGPLVNLPPVGSLVVYFPQGHSEQVAATMLKDADAQIPNYPNLPWKMVCLLHSVTLHADPETDEVYAQMTLQPANTSDKEAFLASDSSLKVNRPQTEFFCKTLTASDTSTHGGFSVPRRAAEKIFPPLDFSMQPPAQELQVKDLHDNVWTFRHIYRGQPKRHLLTTGWSLFVSGKRLVAGDSVLFIRHGVYAAFILPNQDRRLQRLPLFILSYRLGCNGRDEKQQLLLGIRRASRQPTNISSSVLSSDSMQIGILAAAAHAYANHSPFTVFYNPRASPSEFVIPLVKYNKAIYSNQLSLGMRFRMMFETEESGTRRYMGTITGISDLDPVRWKNSKWRNLQVGWDESTAGERRNRVSMWEIEPVQAPFFICPPPFFRSKRPRQPGMPDDDSSDMESLFKRAVPWLGDEICLKDSPGQNAGIHGLSLVQWMNMQNPSLAGSALQPDYLRSMAGPVVQNYPASDISKQLSLQAQMMQQSNMQFGVPKPLLQHTQQVDQLSKLAVPQDQSGAISIPQQQMQQINQQQRQQLLASEALPLNQSQSNVLQSQMIVQSHQLQQQQQPQIQNHQALPPSSSPLNLPQQQQQQQQFRLLQQPQQQHLLLLQPQQQQQQQQQLQGRMPAQLLHHQATQQTQLSEQQIHLQLLHKLQQQQQQQQQQHLLGQPPFQQQQVPEQQKVVPLDQQTPPLPNLQSLPQQHAALNQATKNPPAGMMQYPQAMQHQLQQKFQQPQAAPTEMMELAAPQSSVNLLSAAGSGFLASRGTQSVLTEDVPSCSTSPSTNNCPAPPPAAIGGKTQQQQQHGMATAEEMSQSAVTIMSSASFADIKPSISIAKLQQPSAVPTPRPQHQAPFAPQQAYVNNAAHMDYLDASSSGASACLPQTDAQELQQSFPLSSFSQQPSFFRDGGQGSEVPASDPRNNVLFGVNIESPLRIPIPSDHPLLEKGVDSGRDYHNHLTSDTTQAELSSSMVSQSFGVPDVGLNSIDSTINDGSLLNKCSWAPPPQFQRMRTYTKVYKRGAVGRSIDITRYSGYDDLKQDLARMFSIEGQLEDRQRIGWKLVYVDHENDVLLVGDDPWEEFVNCVRCVRILSPQEVQQMSLDGEIAGNSGLPNQACSSSDGGNAWRGGQCDQNSNPSAGSYGHID